MTTRVLISFFCDDRPGVIEDLSGLVNAHGGNWLESQLSRLGGRFAGIALVSCPLAGKAAFFAAIETLAERGITATVTEAGAADGGDGVQRGLSLLGPDRPGIVLELTRALKGAGFNVLQMETGVETAPMSGEPLFRATATIELLAGGQLDKLEDELDALADRMTLEIDLQDRD